MQRRGELYCCQFSSVRLLRHVWLFANPWTVAPQASLSITNSLSLLRLMSIESVMPSNHLILCHPLLLLPSILPSIRVLSNESVLIRWPKYWSFSFSISSFNEYSGLIFFRIDWCDLLTVQGTLKSLLQHHSSKASILQHSAFLMVWLSHPYMTTGKTIALTRPFMDCKLKAPCLLSCGRHTHGQLGSGGRIAGQIHFLPPLSLYFQGWSWMLRNNWKRRLLIPPQLWLPECTMGST